MESGLFGHASSRVWLPMVTGPFGQEQPVFRDDAFDDTPLVTRGPITAVTAFSGLWMDSIQVHYAGHPGPRHGGSGGSPQPRLVLAAGEDIVAVQVQPMGATVGVETSTLVGTIKLTTSLGRSVVMGPNHAGWPFLDATPAAAAGAPKPVLAAISGMVGAYVNNLTFHWTCLPLSSLVPPVPPPPADDAPSQAPPPLQQPHLTPPHLADPASDDTLLVTGPFGQGQLVFVDPASDDTPLVTRGPISAVTVSSGLWMDPIHVDNAGPSGPTHGGSGGSPQPRQTRRKDFLVNSFFGHASSRVPLPLGVGPFGQEQPVFHDDVFDDTPLVTRGPITAVSAFTGGWMDAIQVDYAGHAGPKHGGPGGSADPTRLVLASGEGIVAVEVQPVSANVDGESQGSFTVVATIRLTTSLGRSVMMGPKHESWPFLDATPAAVADAPRPVLAAISGRVGLYVNSLTFHWRRLPLSLPVLPAALLAEQAPLPPPPLPLQ